MTRARLPKLCFALLLGLTAGLPVFGAVLDAPRTGQVAVMFDPRLSDAELLSAVARADAELVRFGGWPGALIVNLPETTGPEALRAAGAWIVADPIILGGCAVDFETLEGSL